MIDNLRFITCGSVDDGKSTLIGRLLWESKLVFEDHASTLERDSKKHGTQGESLDLALLLDGLQAEREQGITIDVAYRYFATEKRRFVVADTPGHEQYTRNMATGASTAQLAVILIDARKGVLVQTRRHSRIVSMLGIRNVVIAVNKMDLVAWNHQTYTEIERDYREFARGLNFDSIQFIPLSALLGENLVNRSEACTWYSGPTLLGYLETIEINEKIGTALRMPVQWVNRPNLDFRGFCGRVAAGRIAPGERIRVTPSGAESTVKSIVAMSGNLAEAHAGQSVTLTLVDEIDISRGNVICAAESPVEVADQFEAHLLWMSEHAMSPGRLYTIKLHSQTAGASITRIKHRVDVDTGSHLAAKHLDMNEIAVVNLSLDRMVPFEPYSQNRTLGSFILIDRLTHETLGAGMLHFALRRASNIHWQTIDVSAAARAEMKSQQASCFWLTGLSGSGKSTIANLLDKRLHAAGRHTFVLDGDNVRHGLNRDLGFTEDDRVENIRRVAEVAKLMVDAGLIVIVSFISPYRSERQLARALFRPGEFIEVYIDTPLEVCEQRDTKGLYAKARSGALKNFTGIDSEYQAPVSAEVTIATMKQEPTAAAEALARLALQSSANS
jgi:bifunctional enzyme CysN/CysC